MVNVHAWHANTTIQDAATWSNTFFKETGTDLAAALPNKPQMYMAEVGWPTFSSVPVVSTSPASEANLQLFINNFVCAANTQGTRYFFFEFMDIPWKEKRWPGVEGFWGMFYSNKTLKAITLPDCTHT
jgi:exo-beta-1,3-glucanase (GH17 family)